jgi:pyruvate/2-oxoglutarate dehydrogenase complex dihydrolipoamide dehydrogenase (E3) component
VRLAGDAILVGVGRKANVEGLGLEAAGVAYDKDGVKLNDFLQTSNPHVYAAGDVCSAYKFTHAADAMARLVLRNALFFGRGRMSKLVIPWCTFTDPEVAHVGLTAKQASEQGVATDTFRVPLAGVDRALLDGDEEGFALAHIRKGTDRLVGATVVAAHAGEMIGEVALAMTNGLGLAALSRTIHAYPTQAEALRKLGDAYQKSRLTPRVASLFRRLLAWRR